MEMRNNYEGVLTGITTGTGDDATTTNLATLRASNPVVNGTHSHTMWDSN